MWIPIVIDGSFCPVSLGMDYLGAVCPGGGVTGVFSPGYSLSIVRHTSALGDHPCRDSIAQAAVQMRSSVGRGFVSPIQGSMSRCHGMGGGGVLSPGHSLVGSAPFSTSAGSTLLCCMKFCMETLISYLHKGLWMDARPQGRLYPYTNSPQSQGGIFVFPSKPWQGSSLFINGRFTLLA